ncbi:LrgB family protein [Moraxella catarrhalis]|uniref:LrgB family protein n=1 Tax=Moraxella catarrhalis TaxID=480 RepID=UPI00128CF7F1|nr:LrgB family protein [Moraxella catarrhalis]MPX16117.1 murein hydrolase transporter LrgB [Moraxella catarrhalis]
MDKFVTLYQTLSTSPFLLLMLLMGVFELTIWARTRFNQPLINPTLVTTIVVILILKFANIKWQAFEQASSYITFWLQPVVVCLAVPLYIQWQKIRVQWLPILVSQFVASLVGIVSGVWIVRALGGSYDSMIATAAKSVTMPIAIEVTQALGGIIGITAATVLIAGVVGQIFGVWILYKSGMRLSMGMGLSLGSASHALGTVRSMQLGGRYVAYATLGLILNGIMTAFLAPVLVPWLVS